MLTLNHINISVHDFSPISKKGELYEARRFSIKKVETAIWNRDRCSCSGRNNSGKMDIE